MPEITDLEYREYIYLKKKEEIRQQEIDKMMQQGAPKIREWRQDLYSTRGFASVFALILDKEYKRRRVDTFVLDRWSVVKQYLTDKVVRKEKGKTTLNPYFRKLLKEYGWSVKIDRKFGLFQVRKII